MSKSWKITLSTIIIAIIMTILPSFGIENISESQISNLIFLALGVSGIGAGNKAIKHIAKKTTTPPHQEKLTPQLKGTWYKTNMTSNKEQGNVIAYGTPYLYAQITNTKSYTTAKLSRNGTLIQIDQSAVNEPIRLELVERNNGHVTPMPRGEYTLQITGDRGTSDSTGVTDKFSII